MTASMTMTTTLPSLAHMAISETQLRDLIQGPGDEWRSVASHYLVIVHPLNTARSYDMRRRCQEILPHLYLGPLQASKSLDALQSLGVTHMSVLLLSFHRTGFAHP